MGNYCSTTMRIKGEVVTQFEELKKMYMRKNTQAVHGVQAVHLHMIRAN